MAMKKLLINSLSVIFFFWATTLKNNTVIYSGGHGIYCSGYLMQSNTVTNSRQNPSYPTAQNIVCDGTCTDVDNYAPVIIQ